MTVRFLPSGDTALVVEFGSTVDRALHDQVLRLAATLREAPPPGVVETVPTFRSLLVHYDPLATSAAALTRVIETLLRRRRNRARIAACYEGEHAPDLAEVAQRTGLSPAEAIALHSGTRYHVYMIGFVPGFPYLGDLAKPLRLPRRANPRVRVPAGSVAIATAMTGIYPIGSPRRLASHRPGDALPLRMGRVDPRAEVALRQAPDPGFGREIRVVLGPQQDHFTEAALGDFLSAEFRIRPRPSGWASGSKGRSSRIWGRVIRKAEMHAFEGFRGSGLMSVIRSLIGTMGR